MESGVLFIAYTYPARIADVYSIKVVAEKESQGDR